MLFAVVTQVPTADRATPAALVAPEPTHQARAWASRSTAGRGRTGTSSCRPRGPPAFVCGWAFVEAVVVTFSPAGSM